MVAVFDTLLAVVVVEATVFVMVLLVLVFVMVLVLVFVMVSSVRSESALHAGSAAVGIG